MSKWRRFVARAWKLSLIGLFSVLLIACNDVTTSNTVTGTPSQFSYSMGAGTVTNIPITFTTNSGTATNLSITNLSSFPVGLSVPGKSTCQTVTANGTACTLYLSFSPTEPIASSSFAINYSYNAAGGASQTGTVSFDYTVTTNSPSFSYVISQGLDGKVYDCAVNVSNGTFSGCSATPTSPAWNLFAPPAGIAFATSGGTSYAYVPVANGNVYQCSLSSGALSGCSVTTGTGAGWSSSSPPTSIAFATVSGTQYAYVAYPNGGVDQCTLNSNGSFNTCSLQLLVAQLWTPNVISFGSMGGKTYAYVGDTANSNVYECPMDSTGNLYSCVTTPSTGAPSWSPRDVTVATVNGTTYGYVADTTNSKIYQCSLNTGGSLNTCAVTTPSSPSSWAPSSINIRSVNATTYAYVTAGSNVYQCSLNSNGTLNTCSTTPSSGAPSWTPTALGFN